MSCFYRRLRLLPILQELLQPDVGQRVVEQGIDHRRRAGCDVGPHARRFDNVIWVSAAGDENLRRVLVVVEDLDDLANHFHAVRGDVVQPADEGADVAGARLRGEQRLRWREAQRDVDANALARELFARADAVAGERRFDDHVRVDLRDVTSLLQHAREVGRGHFAAHRALDDVADPLEVLPEVARLFRQERRVRRHAVEDAQRGNRLDVLDAAGVHKEFHEELLARRILDHLAVSSTRADGGLRLPAASTARTAYAKRAPDGVWS